MTVLRGRRRAVPWLLSLSLAIAVAMAPGSAHANGAAGRLIRQVAGPYEIALGTIPGRPVVGSLHLTMTVADASSKTSILDADVTVTGRGPQKDAPDIGPLKAESFGGDPRFYDLTTSVDRVGMWTFTVRVISDLGEASADFAIEVREPNPISSLFTWVTVILFVALAALGLLPYLRQRGRRRKQTRC
jgi:hypothetical protein